ncbi:hypothetical protein [Brucella intermedia]|uniref:hypothetical protein n=1 Tax=Brucella intermedia TaxID=94625 RepID=UPI00124C01C5|nr:hypothetical protein [Brucella intermedia]KAB2731290.1 hypothetical protein F9L02_08490 [Brucella intermedia]
MRKELPIATAPKDGRKITVVWTDDDDQRNESIAQYRTLAQLQAGGGQWDEADTGWWTFSDSKTQRKIEPTAWISETDDDEASDS